MAGRSWGSAPDPGILGGMDSGVPKAKKKPRGRQPNGASALDAPSARLSLVRLRPRRARLRFTRRVDDIGERREGPEGAGRAPARSAAEDVDGHGQVRPVRQPSKGWCGLRGRNHEFCPPAAGRPGGGPGSWTRTGTEGFLGLTRARGPGEFFGTHRNALILMGDWCVPDSTASNH